ncbi:hypothetical protein RGAI101_1162 [Roseobacter sp. GAI101]|nr:hypothetical protein RGAI101_1162 [Roseobacter sp. GAI101]
MFDFCLRIHGALIQPNASVPNFMRPTGSACSTSECTEMSLSVLDQSEPA